MAYDSLIGKLGHSTALQALIFVLSLLMLPALVQILHHDEPAGQSITSELPSATVAAIRDSLLGAWDTNADGRDDSWDTDGDGQPDVFDINGDGRDDDSSKPLDVE